ncbi:MAG: glycoside hydrolase, partial [Gammaproteobacteria bacterium]
MPEAERHAVVLCWHMHQPEYREFPDARYRLPWTLLHALKDYVDMAAHLEAEPAAKAVVNFAPVLLEQIADYAIALGRHLRSGEALPDPLLAAIAGELPAEPAARRALLQQCLRANRSRVIARFSAWERLCALAERIGLESEDLDWLSDAYLQDLSVWYLLGWLGETVRLGDPRVKRLQQKARGFDAADRRELLQLVQELLEGVLPRYRALALAGRVELAMSPFAHPILPLLL